MNLYVLLFSFCCAALVTLAGCGTVTGQGGQVGPPTAPPGSPFAVIVNTVWEDASTTSAGFQQTCSIAAGTSSPGTSTCNASVPQGQLFYSKLQLSVFTDGTCDLVFFSPYYYRASNSNAFVPEWSPTTTFNCSSTDLATTPVECLNGPAPTIVTNWPSKTAVFFIPADNANTQIYTVPSAHLQNRKGNRWGSNALPAAYRNTTITGTNDGYIAGSIQDYVFSCTDRYLQPLYSMTLTVQDTPTASGGAPTTLLSDWKTLFNIP